MAVGQKVTLVEVIRDPDHRDYEAEELDPNGHTYLYRYDGKREIFLRAAVVPGAPAPVFLVLRKGDKVPVQGWVRVDKRGSSRVRLRLVRRRE